MYLSEDATWWNHEVWQQGKHRGLVYHGADLLTAEATYYGKPGRVVCLDGVFLAARGAVLREIGLEKPAYFSGNWDFYDTYYTVLAHLKGYHNYVIPIGILHHVGRGVKRCDPWNKNRHAFIKRYALPISVSQDK